MSSILKISLCKCWYHRGNLVHHVHWTNGKTEDELVICQRSHGELAESG